MSLKYYFLTINIFLENNFKLFYTMSLKRVIRWQKNHNGPEVYSSNLLSANSKKFFGGEGEYLKCLNLHKCSKAFGIKRKSAQI